MEHNYKSCPFCGADGFQVHESPLALIATWVECSQCGAHTRSIIADKKLATKEARDAWNRRPKRNKSKVQEPE